MTQTLTRRPNLHTPQNYTVSIYIRNYAKKTIVVRVPHKVKVNTLKENIKQRMKVSQQDQILFLNGVQITDNMGEIQVDNKYIFHLINAKRVGLNRMTVTVRRIQKDSPFFKYNVKGDMKIKDFMYEQLIQNYEDIDNYFLVYTGRQLQPKNTFKTQLIEDNSQIMCVHKIEDRKNKFIEIRPLPTTQQVNQNTALQSDMSKKKHISQKQNIIIAEQKDTKLRIYSQKLQNQTQKLTQQSNQPIQEAIKVQKKQQQLQKKQNKQTTAIDTPKIQHQQRIQIKNDQNQQKINDEQNLNKQQKSQQKQQQQQYQPIVKQQQKQEQIVSDEHDNNDDDFCEEILITNKQQYSIISKNNPGKQNTNIRKKMRSNFAAPQPPRDQPEEDENKQYENRRDELSVSNRDNTHLGLTVISSRHDQQESIQPNQMEYRQMLAKDDQKQKETIIGITRTQSQPLKISQLSELSSKNPGSSHNDEDNISEIIEQPNEQQKISLLEDKNYKKDQTVIVVVQEEQAVCQIVDPLTQQPQMNYDGVPPSQNNYQQKQLKIIEQKIESVVMENGVCEQIQEPIQLLNSLQKQQSNKTEKTKEFQEIMKQRIQSSGQKPVKDQDKNDNRIFISTETGESIQIKDLKPTKNKDTKPSKKNIPDLQSQKLESQPLDNSVKKNKENDDTQNIREDENNNQTSNLQNSASVSENKSPKRVKSESDSLLLDNSQEVLQNQQHVFSGKFSWNNLKDDRNIIDMSAQLQEQLTNSNQILNGNNMKNWEKFSFSFRNNQTPEIRPGDLLMLGNTCSLGNQQIIDDLYAQFEQKFADLQIETQDI